MKTGGRRVADLERRVNELEEVVYWMAAKDAANRMLDKVSARAADVQPKAAGELPAQAALIWAGWKVASIGQDSEQADEDAPF